MLKIGPTEAERFQVIVALRGGASFAEATAELRRLVESDWFERNEEHLHDVAANGEAKPSLAELRTDLPDAETGAIGQDKPEEGKARKGKARKGKE